MKEYYVDLVKLPKGMNRKQAHINVVKKAMEMGYKNEYDSLNKEYSLEYMHLWKSGEITFGHGTSILAMSYDAFMKDQMKKRINAKIDLSWLRNEAREVISEAIQKKLFEADVRWADHISLIQNKESAYLFIDKNNLITKSDEKDVFERCKYPEVSVNNALKGNFWTYSTNKEEPKPEGYKVSLAAYTGKAREAGSKAIQEEAFKKGYGWGWIYKDATIQNTGTMLLYFSVEDKAIMQDSTEDKKFFSSFRFKELSVEEILSGALPKVN